ncbi:SGNH/GDSL hydrolase family protein [bacterium]|nr:SGNH/GDSL hydrolase family protein [bacterium]
MRRVLLAAAAVIGALFLFEIAIRFAWPRVTERGPYLRFSNPHRDQTGFERDPYLFWKLRPDNAAWQVNEAGFRGPIAPIERRDDEFRVICLGDSCTFGLGEGGVPYENTYAAVLESLLAADLDALGDPPGKPDRYATARVLNFGVPGYTSLQGLRYFQTYAGRFAPSVVVAYFGINDGFEAIGFSDEAQPRPDTLAAKRASSGLSRLAIYSAMRTVLVDARRLLAARSGPPLERVSIEAYHENLDKIASYARSMNARALFIAPPYLEEDGTLKQETHRIHAPAVDVMPPLRAAREAGAAVIFPSPDNVHPTPAGHAAIAQALREAIVGE